MTASVQYSAMADELTKIAQQPQDAASSPLEEQKLPPHPALTAGKGALGFGAGLGAGYLGAKGLDLAMGGPGKLAPWGLKAAPVLTGLGGLAYMHSQGVTLDKMREDAAVRRRMKEAQRGRVNS